MRALVTGATGFLGANLVRALIARGDEVHALLRPTSPFWRLAGVSSKIECHVVDLTDLSALRSIFRILRPEVGFHLAAGRGTREKPNRQGVFDSNVVAAFHLLEASRELDAHRIVCTGFSMEYARARLPLREDMRLEPRDFYSATKAAATELFHQAARTEGRPIVVLRPFSIFGPWECAHRLVPTAIRAALEGAALALTAADWYRDFVFVEDVVEACLLADTTPGIEGEIINVGTGRQRSNREVVASVEAALGVSVNVRAGAYTPHATDTKHWVADVEKARTKLGWQAHHSLEQGIQKTVDWTREWETKHVHPMLRAARRFRSSFRSIAIRRRSSL